MATGEKRYRDFSDFLNLHFDCKVQKISLHAGFTCPNRDGSIGVGGCTYCNNQTFSPDYCHTGKSITSQLEEGIAFFARKYPEMHYLAYFQAYTNTYGELAVLKQKYEEALFHPGVVGIIVERCGELRNRSMKVSVSLPGSIRDKDIWLIFRRIRTRMRR